LRILEEPKSLGGIVFDFNQRGGGVGTEPHKPPHLIMQAFQLCMPPKIGHPRPAKRRPFNYAAPIFMGNTKEIQFLSQTSALPLCSPGRRSDVPSIMQMQTYLGGFTPRQSALAGGFGVLEDPLQQPHGILEAPRVPRRRQTQTPQPIRHQRA